MAWGVVPGSGIPVGAPERNWSWNGRARGRVASGIGYAALGATSFVRIVSVATVALSVVSNWRN